MTLASKLLLFVGSIVIATAKEDESLSPDHGVLDWIRGRKGAFFHPALEARHNDPNDPTSFIGLFSSDDIDQGEVLMKIPWDSLIHHGGRDRIVCNTVFTLAEELRKGNESEYAPYMSYLLSRKTGLIPSFWSDAGMDLLTNIEDGQFSHDEYLAAMQEVFANDPRCSHVSDDPIFNRALEIMMLRADDDLLTPGYDLANHQNGGYLNMDQDITMHKDVTVKALKPIRAGDQIINSYNMCVECGNRIGNGYGTAGKRFFIPFNHHA